MRQRNAYNIKFIFKHISRLVSSVKKYIKGYFFPSVIKEKGVVEGYDIWAENYDMQPGNLMFDLDKNVFEELLKNMVISNKKIADIGCGTGRHWPEILSRIPATLTGFDVSPNMLGKLKTKFPSANTALIKDNYFLTVKDGSFDLIVSTLTVAHIKDITTALTAWSRILKADSDIIITDFHPTALAAGGQRSFKHQNKFIAVKNFVHTTAALKQILLKENFTLVNEIEIKIDEKVRHYYKAQDALHVYEKFKGSPIIYGLHFRREK